MKKYLVVFLLLLIFVTGCDVIDKIKGTISNDDGRTPEVLLDKYTEAFLTQNPDLLRDIVPKFMYDYAPDKFTKEYITSRYNNEKNHFGDDINAKYEITEKKHLEGDDLADINSKVQSYFKTSASASDCYYLDGVYTIYGSKATDPDPLDTYYCKYDGTWYLIIG